MLVLACSVGKTNVVIQVKPSKLALANAAFKASACVLIPESMAISVVLQGCAPPSAAIAIDMDGDLGFKMFVQPHPLQMADGLKKPLISPFWAVRATTKASDANMEWTRMSCTISAKIGGKAAVNHEIKFFAISNHKPLKKDDELILKSDPKDMKASSSSAPPAKKNKKSN